MTRALLVGVAGAVGALAAGCDAGNGDPLQGVGVTVAVSGAATSSASANYQRLQEPNPRCPGELDFGSCSLFDCFLPAGQLPELAEPGVVTILGGIRDVELTPTLGYQEDFVDAPLFVGGEALTFRVEGGDGIEAHDAEVVAPTPITLVEPLLTEVAEIDRLEDIVVRWTGGEGQFLQVSLRVTQRVGDEIRYAGVSCDYDDLTLESVLFPSDLMRSLPPVTDAAEATLLIGVRNGVDGDVPGWLYGFYAVAGESTNVTLR